MTTTRMIEGLIAFALLFVSGGLAIPGWLTERPDSPARFRLRFLSVLALGGWWFLIDPNPHGVWQWVLHIAFGWWLLTRATHWWRATERARKAEAEHARLVAALKSGRPMWLPNDGRGVSGG